jgi:hypothetical protein
MLLREVDSCDSPELSFYSQFPLLCPRFLRPRNR